LPMDRLEFYGGAGVGVYSTSLRVKESSFNSERDDTGVGVQGLIGAEYFLSRNISIGLEYRKFKLRADLEPTIPGKIDVGGDFVFATVRGHF
ncbi:MAG: outer membrane beta-barrel protein, partial [Betaproteobacteria bacterium]